MYHGRTEYQGDLKLNYQDMNSHIHLLIYSKNILEHRRIAHFMMLFVLRLKCNLQWECTVFLPHWLTDFPDINWYSFHLKSRGKSPSHRCSYPKNPQFLTPSLFYRRQARNEFSVSLQTSQRGMQSDTSLSRCCRNQFHQYCSCKY